MTRKVPDKTSAIGYQPWKADAACRDHPPQWWFPTLPLTLEVKHGIKAAKAVCATCPVRDECLDYSLRWEPDGIWGGMGTKERRDLRRIRGVSLRQLSDPNRYVGR